MTNMQVHHRVSILSICMLICTAQCNVSDTNGTDSMESSDDKEGCNFDGFHAVGETWSTDGPQGCRRYTCTGKDRFKGTGCSEWYPPEGCDKVTIHANLQMKYPDCCPYLYVCPEGDSNRTGGTSDTTESASNE